MLCTFLFEITTQSYLHWPMLVHSWVPWSLPAFGRKVQISDGSCFLGLHLKHLSWGQGRKKNNPVIHSTESGFIWLIDCLVHNLNCAVWKSPMKSSLGTTTWWFNVWMKKVVRDSIDWDYFNQKTSFPTNTLNVPNKKNMNIICKVFYFPLLIWLGIIWGGEEFCVWTKSILFIYALLL